MIVVVKELVGPAEEIRAETIAVLTMAGGSVQVQADPTTGDWIRGYRIPDDGARIEDGQVWLDGLLRVWRDGRYWAEEVAEPSLDDATALAWKEQPGWRDEKGRWKKQTGSDWSQIEDGPGGDRIRATLEKIPTPVKDEMVERGLTLTASKDFDYGFAAGVYSNSTDKEGMPARHVGVKVKDDEPVDGTPETFVVAHEMGHAFDHLFSPDPDARDIARGGVSQGDFAKSRLSAGPEWRALVDKGTNGWDHETDTDNMELFASTFAVAIGETEPDLEQVPLPPRMVDWMRRRIEEEY